MFWAGFVVGLIVGAGLALAAALGLLAALADSFKGVWR
jgi:hypothetical protein